MKIDEVFQKRLERTFGYLASHPAGIPKAGSLSVMLRKEGSSEITIRPQQAAYFGTAAVEIWHRSVHSFLVSVALSEISPIWSSVSGYYSSHYSIRGFAHLLGFFNLFKDKKLAVLEIGPRSGFTCKFKRGGTKEHHLYWELVKSDLNFSNNDFFTKNNNESEESDVSHRNYANYFDHISGYVPLRMFEENKIKKRLEKISKYPFFTAPIPRVSKFPDVEFVQLIAYFRLITFNQILDQALGSGHRFWGKHRTPSFAEDYLDYQINDQSGISKV